MIIIHEWVAGVAVCIILSADAKEIKFMVQSSDSSSKILNTFQNSCYCYFIDFFYLFNYRRAHTLEILIISH